MEEQWRPINERYEVSNFGNVRSYVDFHGRVGTVPHLLKPHKDNNGYYMIMLYFKNKHKYMPVHRLVATAFIPNPNNYRCVNHKDENKLNNSVDNLEWCTHKYNNGYGTKKERLSKALTQNQHFIKPVYQLDKQGNIINEFPSIIKAAEYIGCTGSEIAKVCKGLEGRKQTHGYGWKYKQV